MAFCSKCGNHLEGNERFCVKCGADLAATPPSATPPAAPAPSVAAPAAQYAVPAGYAPPGSVPVAMQIPAASPKRLPWLWIVICLALAGTAFYYYHQTQLLQAEIARYKPIIDLLNDTTGGDKGNGNNNNNGGGPGGGGGDGGGNNTQALMQQQVWHQTAWQVSNGVVVVQGTWQNNSGTSIRSGTLTCSEYDANNQPLGSLSTTLYGPSDGPVLGGNIYTYNSLNMGAPAANLDKLGCALTSLTT